MGSLTNCGIFWALTSFLAALIASAGFYFPYWLKGSLNGVTVYFGVFRRCNYPKVSSEGLVPVIVNECGRYATFSDIPSLSWQIATVTIGVGCGMALLVSFVSILSMCISRVMSPTVARSAGIMQFCAGLLIGGGVALYPNGFDVLEIQQACGHKSDDYVLGDCSFYWSFYLTAAGSGVTLLWSFISCHAAKKKRNGPVAYRDL